MLPGLGAILSRSQGTATSRAACEERETSGDVFVMFCLGFAAAALTALRCVTSTSLRIVGQLHRGNKIGSSNDKEVAVRLLQL